jgi:hypothetical protein
MTYEGDSPPGLADLLSWHDGVLRVDSAMKFLTRDALRWRVSSGRWQQPCRGIVVAQSGADMDRDNDLTVDGYRVLRFPAFLVRYHPGYVAGKIRAALQLGVGIQIPA